MADIDKALPNVKQTVKLPSRYRQSSTQRKANSKTT